MLARNIMLETPLKSYPNIRQSFGIAGINILILLVLSPLMFLLSEFLGKEAAMLVYYSLGMGISFSIIYTIWQKKTGRFSFPIFRFNRRLLPSLILCTLALLFGIVTPLANLIPLSESMRKLMLEFGAQTGILAFITMVVIAPVVEELIYRGIILDGLIRKYSPWKAILISSLIFGLVHLNPWQLITGFVIGIFIGWAYYYTRNLAVCIAIHATANLAGFTARFFVDVDSLVNNHGIENYGNLGNLIAVITGALIILFGCVWHLNREFLLKEGVNSI
jgi:membrane protease YdiL (CAAX protease family)